MKFKKIIIFTSLATVLFAAGCKKEKFDINSNPDSVTDVSVTPSVLLPGAQQFTSSEIAGDWAFLQMWMGYWARSGSYQSITDVETYRFTNDFQAGIWFNLYANANNYNIMINKAKESGAGTYEAIGRIMKSHCFQMLTDIYGNLPYSEALLGTVKPTPKYDKAVDIYKAIFADLDIAIALLNNPAVSSVTKNPDIHTADIVYGNPSLTAIQEDPEQIKKWKKFANTLRLRMIIHLHNGVTSTTVAPGISVSEQVAKITTEGFLGSGESAHLNPGFSGSKPQPYYRFYNTNESGSGSQRDQYRAGKYALEYYRYNSDPRINRFYVSPSGTTAGQTGITFGTPAGNQDLIGSKLSTVRGPGLSPDGAASRSWILTSVESFFLQAEARQRGVLTSGPTAKELLAAAVRESFIWLKVGTTDVLSSNAANSYISANAGYPDVDYDEAGGGLFTILSQKWFALNTIAPFETWSDYRRTDYVLGTPVGYDAGPPISVDPGNTSTKIPRRLLYPQTEYNYNAANVGAEGTIDVFTGKIFWDLN